MKNKKIGNDQHFSQSNPTLKAKPEIGTHKTDNVCESYFPKNKANRMNRNFHTHKLSRVALEVKKNPHPTL